jgi:uncharacterized protein YoxC
MKTFIIISVIIFLASFVTLVVYLILTLVQINRTAKQIQKVVEKIDKNLEDVSKISYKVFSGINAVTPIIFSLTGLVTSRLLKILTSIFFWRKEKNE